MPSFRPPKDAPNSGYQEWLRGLEKVMRGGPGRAREPTPGGQSPRGAHEHAIEGDIVPGIAQQSAVVREKGGGVPSENDPRVWDLYRPYVLPVAVFAGLGLFVVFGVLVALRWYTSAYSGPSQQQRFDALWGAHRRGDDLASPEAIEEVDRSEAAKTAPAGKAPPENSPKVPLQTSPKAPVRPDPPHSARSGGPT